MSHPLRTDRCVIPPGVLEWACNDDWFDTVSLSVSRGLNWETVLQTQTRTCCGVSDTTPRELLSIAGST